MSRLLVTYREYGRSAQGGMPVVLLPAIELMTMRPDEGGDAVVAG
jgi:hypothetical protein